MANFKGMLAQCNLMSAHFSDVADGDAAKDACALLKKDIEALVQAERGDSDKEEFRGYLFNLFKNSLRKEGIRDGVIAEIGGSMNSFLDQLPQFEAKFLSIFPDADPRMIVADITNCPHVADNSFDAMFSVSVLEHVKAIHDGAREMVRILKPGGLMMHAVPFSYFFHGAPVDFWRVTTSALEGLFEELETIDCFFYSANRRRNNLGSPANPIDRDGGEMFAADAFGGWRENWFTVYIGRKNEDSAGRLAEKRAKQLHIDLIKGLVEKGLSEEEAIERSLDVARHVSFAEGGRVVVSREPFPQVDGTWKPDADMLGGMWRVRSKKTVRPSVARYNLMAILAANDLV